MQNICKRGAVIISFFFLIILFPLQSIAQKIDSILNIYGNQFQQERMHLHIDKDEYTPGETIWFKAYIMAGIFPTEISKNFYLDWIDEEGNIILHTTAPIIEAAAFGQFQIPADYTGTSIYLRAYTNWMLNFDSAFLYRRTINVFQKVEKKNPAVALVPNIQFFPEGGDIIEGINCKIAFKANDQYGIPVNVYGEILNSKGLLIDSFKSVHDGMGYFFLQAQPDEAYTAKWYDAQKVLHKTKLPLARKTGASLQLSLLDGRLNFKISRSPDADSSIQQLHFIATVQQQLVYMANVNLTNSQSGAGSLPLGDLPTGVLQFTLFDANYRPLAERISFINNQEALFYPEVGFSALGLSKRARNMLVIAVPDSIDANLSVSVTDLQLSADTQNNIISQMLLNGDIRGGVYNSAYYFSDTTAAIAQHLDLVMLTHGWRRFNWPEIVKGKMPTIKYPADSAYLTLTGRVFGATPMQMREAGSIITILIAKDSSKQVLTLPLKSDGRFLNPETVFYDTLKVLYQFPDNKLAELTEVNFSNGLLPVPKYSKPDRNKEMSYWKDTSAAYKLYLLKQILLNKFSEGTTLSDVVVSAKVKTPVEKLDEQYTSGLFKGDALQFDMINDPTAKVSPSVFNYLQGRVAGLTISLNNNAANLSWRGGTPQVYLDEVAVQADQVLNLPMSNVAYVKVFRPPFMGGFNGAGGAIAVYTRKGEDRQISKTNKGLPYKYVAGYTALKQFYSPNYGSFDQRNEKEDVRTTLYWNPMVLTTPTKHILRLEFYNNDAGCSFRVVVEGFSKDGKFTRIEKIIE